MTTEKQRLQSCERTRKYNKKKRKEKYSDDILDHRLRNRIGDTLLNWSIIGEFKDSKNFRSLTLECSECGRQKSCRSMKFRSLSECRHKTGRADYKDICHAILPKKMSLNGYLKKVMSQTANRNLEFSLTVEDLESCFIKQDHMCPYTGMYIQYQDGSASLDRIDSSRGYVVDNIQWVYKPINFMKGSFTHDRFIELCSLVYNNIR
jgi:hypothetical protein